MGIPLFKREAAFHPTEEDTLANRPDLLRELERTMRDEKPAMITSDNDFRAATGIVNALIASLIIWTILAVVFNQT